MLQVYDSLKAMPFEMIMYIYEQSNREIGRRMFPYETDNRQLQLAEKETYNYYRYDFFCIKGSLLFVWFEKELPVCALRMEPYKGGRLLTGLETAILYRKQGYAKKLIRAVQAYCSADRGDAMYSHVHKKNTASIRTHESCGFVQALDYAALIDGSIDSKYITMVYLPESKKSC